MTIFNIWILLKNKMRKKTQMIIKTKIFHSKTKAKEVINLITKNPKI